MSAGPTPQGMPQPGDPIAGRYRVEKLIGAGGMGCVLAAEHLLLRTRVAIKLLLPQAAAWPGATERFLREAQAAATLRGEHVARVIDMGTIESGAPFMVMELLEGRDLQKVIQERAPLSIHEAVDYALQTCDAIHEAHSLGILHRDIKPANIFVTTRPNGTPLVRVLDFGLAKVRAPTDGAPSAAPEASLTQTGQIIGSPHYMPPEQFRGLRHADARSDIWALGVVLYEMLTGRRPFTGEGTGGVMASIFSDDPVSLLALRPDAPPPLDEIVMSCLAKRPDRRPQQVAALIAALEPFAARPDRASQAWIDPAAGDPLSRSAAVFHGVPSPAAGDPLSRSAGVSYGIAPPPGSGTVRIGAAPLPVPRAGPVLGRGPGAGASQPGGPPLWVQAQSPEVPTMAASPGTAASATTAPATGVSTSAYMGIATPVVATDSQPLELLTGSPATGGIGAFAPAAGSPPSPAASSNRLAWILVASVAAVIAVVGMVARAVVSTDPVAAGASSGDLASEPLLDAPPARSVAGSPAPLPSTEPAPEPAATPTRLSTVTTATANPSGSAAPPPIPSTSSSNTAVSITPSKSPASVPTGKISTGAKKPPRPDIFQQY